MTESGTIQARRFLVSGRVQGVGFRYFVMREARSRGLAGWVRNLPDGRVEIQAAGTSAVLEELGERLRQGPPSGRVSRLEEEALSPVPSWDGFDVRF